jgi:hypothetical protein
VRHLRVRQISATLSGFASCMRGPWNYESPGCASVGGEFWFPERGAGDGVLDALNYRSEETQIAISVCNSCAHKSECQQWGLEHEKHGIWGGLNENERRHIRRRLNIIVEEVGVVNFTTGVGNSTHQSNTST